MADVAKEKSISPLARFLLDLGPLAVFFVANSRWDIFAATAAFMVAITASLALSYLLERRLSILPVITAVMVLFFGGLTLVLNDETFIKLKPTIANLLIASTLFVGLALNRPFLRIVLGAVFELQDIGWRKLTWRWAWFFVALALLNEAVWRTMSTDIWVNFKVFAIMPLTVVFSMAQLPLLNRYKAVAVAGERAE